GLLHLDRVGMVHQLLGQKQDQFFHGAQLLFEPHEPARRRLRCRHGRVDVGRFLGCFVRRRVRRLGGRLSGGSASRLVDQLQDGQGRLGGLGAAGGETLGGRAGELRRGGGIVRGG